MEWNGLGDGLVVANVLKRVRQKRKKAKTGIERLLAQCHKSVGLADSQLLHDGDGGQIVPELSRKRQAGLYW